MVKPESLDEAKFLVLLEVGRGYQKENGKKGVSVKTNGAFLSDAVRVLCDSGSLEFLSYVPGGREQTASVRLTESGNILYHSLETAYQRMIRENQELLR